MSYLPFIVVPPLTSCENSYVLFGQGTPPYTIFPIGSGLANNSISLERIPNYLSATAGYLNWKVDFDVGANLTWVVIDDKNHTAYSDYRVVQSNGSNSTTCPKTIYPDTAPAPPTSTTGPIVGGAIGGIIVILLALWGLLTYLKKRRGGDELSRSNSLEDLEMSQNAAVGGATGVRRAGTFNLHNVEFTDTEISRQALENPPSYTPPHKRHFFSNRSRSNTPVQSDSPLIGAGSSSASRRTSADRTILEEGEPVGSTDESLNSSAAARGEVVDQNLASVREGEVEGVDGRHREVEGGTEHVVA